ELTRVARPTSMTMESASRTREMEASQAMRCSVLVEMGSELEVCRRRTHFVLQAFQGRRPVDVRSHPMAPRQRALVHGVVDELADGVVHTLGMDALVVRTSSLGKGLQRRLQRRTTLGVEDAVDGKHAVGHQADVEAPPPVVLLRLIGEAVGVGGMPGDPAEHAKVKDREAAAVVEHLLFVEEISLLTQLLA